MVAAGPTTKQVAGVTNRSILTAANPNAPLQIAQRGVLQATELKGLEAFGASVPAIILGMVDTFAESLSFGLVEDDDLEDYLLTANPRFGQFFKESRAGFGAIGDVLGAFIPGTLALKAVRSKSFFNKASNVLGKDYARFVTSTGKSNQELFAKNFQEARLLGTKGVTNLKAPGLSNFTAAKRKALGRSVADTLIETVAADMAIAATQYKSDFLFPEEMSLADHLAWGLGTTGVVGGIAHLIASSTMRKGIQQAVRQGRSDVETIADIINTQVAGNVLGNRGTAIAARSFLLEEANERLAKAQASGDNISREAALRETTALEQQLKDLTDKAFQDSPIEGVTTSVQLGKDLSASSFIKTALAAYKNDPNLGIGLRSFEAFSREELISFNSRFDTVLGKNKVNRILAKQEFLRITKTISDREAKGLTATKTQNKTRKRLANKWQKLSNEVDSMERTVPIVVEIDGTTSVSSSRATMFQDGARNIANHPEGVSSVKVNKQDFNAMSDGRLAITPEQKKLSIELDETGGIINPSLKNVTPDVWQSMSHLERTASFDAMQNTIERISLNIDAWKGMTITPQSHFTQIDFALEMVKRNKDAAINKIGGLTTIEDLQFQSLAGKFEAFQRLRKQAVDAQVAGRPTIYSDLDNMARALNLPKDSHPIMMLFEKSQVLDGTIPLSSIVKDLDDIQVALKDMLGIPQTKQLQSIQLDSSMLNLPRDRRPMIAVMENIDNRGATTRADLQEQVYIERGTQAAILQQARNAEMVQAVMGVLNDNLQTVAVAKAEVRTVIEGNLAEGDLLKNFVQQSFRFRDQDAFRAFDTITDLSDKVVDKLIENTLKTTLIREGSDINVQASFSNILRGEKRVDLDSLMSARHSLGAGWDVSKAPFQATRGKSGETMFHVLLDPKSQRNKDIWRQMFDEDMPQNTSIRMPQSGVRDPVTLTTDARDALEGMNVLSQKLLTNVNALRRARNMKEIGARRLHLPAPDFSNKRIAYLIDETGKVNTVKSANTDTALRNIVEKEIELAAKQGRQLSQVSEDTMQRYYDARSESFFGMTDFSNTAKQTGPATGKAFGGVIDTGPDAFRAMLEAQLRQFSDVARETRMVLFDPEVQFLKLQRAKSGVDPDKQTIFDDLISRIAGVSNLNAKSTVGKAYGTVETLYDKALQTAYSQLGTLKGAVPSLGLAAKRAQQRADEVNVRFQDAHAPFKNMTDYMERTNEFKLPVDLRRHAAALNEITTAVTIRIMDVGMGIVNMVSLAATLPPVVAMLKQHAGESTLDWQKRIGSFSSTTVKDATYLSPAKAVTDGIHFGFSKEGRAIAAEASELGYLDQFAAEQIEIFSRTGEQFLQGMLRNFANKLSVITDKTERWARGAAWMTFYNIGRKGMGLEKRAAMTFAHQQANNVIADFRPTNRPLIFQGAAGMPLGLFTTYMWNYMQRFVGLAETIGTGGGKTLALQVGLQGSLFGAESLPGWQQYTGLFMNNYDGSNSPVDRLNEAFGSMGADVFLNGTVSNLPRLFGSDDGISIGPRAGVGLPFQQGFSAQSIAGVRLMTRVGQTAGAIIDSTIQNQGVDAVHISEIIAAANINKGVSNLIELGITNKSVDHRGGIIEPDVQFGANIATASRALGFRPLFADELRQENVRNRATDRVRAELKNRLATTLKSKIRGGRLKADDVEDALESYIKAGGNAESFKRFFQSQIVRGTESKVESEIAKAIRNSADSARLGRLLLLSRD